KSEQDRRAVLCSQLGECFVKEGGNFCQVGRGVVWLDVHFDRSPFTELTTTIASHGFGGDEASVTMQPSAKHDAFGKGAGLAGEVHKYGLGDVLRQVRVAIHQPQRCGINQIDVAQNQFTEGGFRAVLHVIREQNSAVLHLQFIIKDPLPDKNRQKLLQIYPSQSRSAEVAAGFTLDGGAKPWSSKRPRGAPCRFRNERTGWINDRAARAKS